MPSFTGVYVQPGAYTKFKPTTAFPVIPGGLRVVAVIGKGSTSKPIIGETVTMTVSATYALAHTAIVISDITDDAYYEYVQDVDYALSGGKVHWLATNALVVSSNAATVTSTFGTAPSYMDGLTFLASIGGVPVTVTFTATVTNARGVASWMNAFGLGAYGTATAVTAGYVQVTATIGTGFLGSNSSILIGNGTANTILGFVPGATYYGSKNPTSGQLFFVDYRYEKVTVTDYAPLYYYNMNDIITDFGAASTTNTLALGAQSAFENGAQVILTCQIDPANNSYVTALTNLETKACNVVTVMNTDPTLLSYIKAHVDKMSAINERQERTAIAGTNSAVSITQIEAQATSLADKRFMLVYPTTSKMLISNVDTSVDSCYLAAALAGIRCNPNYDVAEPLTRKPVVGFTEITDNLSTSQKNDLASHGICIIESDSSGIARVRHALTTDMSTVQNEEYSITEVTDYVAQVSRQILEQMYVGTKILTDTPLMVAATLTTVLNNLITRGIITAFTGLTASIDSTDSTQIDVRFGFAPVYGANYIYIEFTINA